jgi:hypothetical protein
MSNARKGAPKPPDAFQYFLKLLDSVDLCKNIRHLMLSVRRTMYQQSWSHHQQLDQSIRIWKKCWKPLQQYRALLMLVSLELCHHHPMYGTHILLWGQETRERPSVMSCKCYHWRKHIHSWVLRVGSAFVRGKYFITESTGIRKHEADELYKIMKGQFSSLLNSHLLDQQMHNHECIIFVW